MNIYEALVKDHEEVKELLKELVALKVDDDYRYVLVEEIRNALIPHSRAEESVFYNSIRSLASDREQVMHGFKEHLEAETLLRSLQVMDKLNLEWKPLAMKLQTALEHHIREEETEIFAQAKSLFSEEEAISMAEAFEKLKPEVQKQGFMGTTFDIIVNLMPPRLAKGLRNLGIQAQNH
jgi:hemerythrin superfamily protein